MLFIYQIIIIYYYIKIYIILMKWSKCVCVCVCVCDSLKEHVVANSALYVVTVNGRMHRDENSGPKQRILDVLGQKQFV